MKALKWLDDNLEASMLIFLSILTVVIVFVQVFMRYVMGSSLVWSEELARYAFIWMIYIGVSYGVKRKAHISVDIADLIFHKKGQFVLSIIASIAFLFFAVVISYYTFSVMMDINRTSPAMAISMKWVYAAPVVGMALTAIRVIQNIKINVDKYRLGE